MEVLLHLAGVLGRHLRRPLQVVVNFLTLIDLFNIFLPLNLDLVDVSFELGNHRSHLILISMLFADLALEDLFALGELLIILIHVPDLSLQIVVLSRKLI